MAQYCTVPRKEEGIKYRQEEEDAQIHINLAEEDTYSNVEGFEMFSLGVEETINEIYLIDADITGIERRIFGGTDEHSFLNKGNKIQVPVKVVNIWWLILDRNSTVNSIMNKEMVKDICNACGRFVHVHYNAGTKIIIKEVTLPGFGTIWFDNRCIANILSLSKAKNRYRIMYDSAGGKKFIMVMPDKEALVNESGNGIYYHDLEDSYLVLVNTVEENREGFSRR